MTLYTFCKYCENEIRINSHSNTRPELRQEIGETSKHKCSNCNQTTERHVNEIKAKPSQKILLLGVLLGVAFTLVLIFIFGFIASVTFAIPFYIYNSQLNNAKLFNAYRVTSYPK